MNTKSKTYNVCVNSIGLFLTTAIVGSGIYIATLPFMDFRIRINDNNTKKDSAGE